MSTAEDIDDDDDFDDEPLNSGEPPARPKRLVVKLERLADGLQIQHAPKQYGTAVFLSIWLAFWTMGCVGLLFSVFANPLMVLFGIPFWASWFFVAALLSSMLFFREEFTLSRAGAKYRSTILGRKWKNADVPLAEIASFESRNVSTDSDNINYQIVMDTVGPALQFGSQLLEDEREWLAWTLNEELATLRKSVGLPEEPPQNPLDSVADNALSAIELRPPAETVVSRPSQTLWERKDDFDTIEFSYRGQFSFVSLGTTLFVNLFWNGIVGVFASALFGFSPDGEAQPLKGFEWWKLFLFLIPFVLAGLAMFVALIAVVLEPFRRVRWIFKRDSIEYRVDWFGIGRTWIYNFRELDRLELRSSKGKSLAARTTIGGEPMQGAAASHCLVGIDPAGTEVFTLDGFTLAEACWLADAMLRERPLWFRP